MPGENFPLFAVGLEFAQECGMNRNTPLLLCARAMAPAFMVALALTAFVAQPALAAPGLPSTNVAWVAAAADADVDAAFARAKSEKKPVLLYWGATWCPPCLREMPLLEAADQMEGVSVVVVNQGEDLLPIVRYLDEQQLVFRHALRDPRQLLMAEFAAPGLPTTVLFDAQGRTLDVHVGELTRAHLERWLND